MRIRLVNTNSVTEYASVSVIGSKNRRKIKMSIAPELVSLELAGSS